MIPDEAQCVSILEREGADPKLIEHCRAVASLADRVAQKISVKLKINSPAILAGALLHDLGRTKTQGAEHGVIGAKIARSYGVDDSVCRIIERHVGPGFTDSDAVVLGLPLGKIYLPTTIEEKIVCYSDKLAYPGGTATRKEALESYEAEFGKGAPLERLRLLLEEISSLC